MLCTGVPKSVTSRRRRRLSGRLERRNSTTRLAPCCGCRRRPGCSAARRRPGRRRRAAAEVDVLERQLAAVQALGEARGRLRAGVGERRRHDVLERDDEHLAVELGAIARRLLEVEHERVRSPDWATLTERRFALVDVDHRLAEGAGDAGRSIAIRGGAWTVKPAGTAASGSLELDADHLRSPPAASS
jgi:hypothetical protein